MSAPAPRPAAARDRAPARGAHVVEDVIRVAQAKIDPARIGRIAGELGIEAGGAVSRHRIPQARHRGDVLSCFRRGSRARILGSARSAGWLGRVHCGHGGQDHLGHGYLRFWLLAKLRRWRPRILSLSPEEQAQIESWLALVARSREDLAGCAGSRRMRATDQGLRRHPQARRRRTIADRGAGHSPARSPAMPVGPAIDAIASARAAALLDPEGERPGEFLDALRRPLVHPLAAEQIEDTTDIVRIYSLLHPLSDPLARGFQFALGQYFFENGLPLRRS